MVSASEAGIDDEEDSECLLGLVLGAVLARVRPGVPNPSA